MKKIIFCVLISSLFFIFSVNGAVALACVEEGKTFDSSQGNDIKCCEGLQEKSQYDARTCIALPSLNYTCVKCGNGECGLGENKCNCPGDCNLTSCFKEGEIFSGTSECCPGLKKILEKDNIGGAASLFICTSKCGNGACDTDTESNYNCPGDCKDEVVGGDRDEHGCIGSAGYSWCEAKQKCLRTWEESCLTFDDKNGEVKIMPETASQRAIEVLGDLGFTVTLKEVGEGDSITHYYEASGLKEGKFLGLFKVNEKISIDIDAETGKIIKIHKPWWSFLVW